MSEDRTRAPRAPTIVKSLLLLSAAAFLGVLVLALRGKIDFADHERYRSALQRTAELDARLGEEIARSRLGLVLHYDGLVRLEDVDRQVRGALRRWPEHLGDASRRALEPRLASYERSSELSWALIEAFKTDQAVLRNSLHALPRNVDRALDALGVAPEQEPPRAVLRNLLRHALSLALEPSTREHVEPLRCRLAQLGDGALCAGDERVADVPQQAAIVRHARIIAERTERVARSLQARMNVPIRADAQALLAAYERAHAEHAAHQLRLWRLLAIIGALLCLLVAAFIIARLHAAAHALTRTKGELEVALEELRRERDHEMELASLKSRFVSMTSHEFRTPLSVILSSAELLEAYGETWPAERHRTHLGRIQAAAQGMARMLDGVLLIGRAEAGMLELKPGPLRPAQLASQIADEIRGVVGGRALEFDAVDVREMWLDENLLRHVLTNLLSNAFKYSPEDSVVRLRVEPTEGGVRFVVVDEGIGIPEADRERLFEAFHRCGNAESIPGTGLGLAVVKKSVEAHRGTIEVESREGEGTRFRVEVPDLEEAA